MRVFKVLAAVLFALAPFPALCDPPEAPPRPLPQPQRPARNKARRQRAQRGRPRPPKPRPKILADGRWDPEVRLALEDLMIGRGVGSPGYSPLDPPTAVVVWDVAAAHNPGDALFYRLVTRAEFKFDSKFWDLIPVVYGRERIRAAYNAFSSQPRSVWGRQPEYWMFRKAFFGCQQRICSEQGREACARWTASLLAGFEEKALSQISAETIEQDLKGRSGVESEGDSPEDPAPVKVHVGLREVPEMRDLFGKLKERGFDVWVLSTADQWSLEAFSALYGVHPTRALGVRPKVVDGKVTGDVPGPVPSGEGEVDVVATNLGGPPVLTIAGPQDDALLKYSAGVRVKMIAPQDRSGYEREWGWLVQVPFTPL